MTRIALLATLAFAGCAASAPLAETEIALTTAERAALAYATLPACPAVALCHKPGIVTAIKQADDVAYAAVKAARTGVGSVATAQAAVAALAAIVPVQ